MKANYTEKPKEIEPVGDGSNMFRYNITESEGSWNCDEVIVWGAIDSKKITAACIDDQWGGGIEQKLINDYNAHRVGLMPDQEAEDRYIQFLTKRAALKQQIDEIIQRYKAQ